MFHQDRHSIFYIFQFVAPCIRLRCFHLRP
nr:MAG TPA: Neuronal acetylcholine receptor subunit beta-2 acetylcholine receptor, first transmembrane [Caudoviricetes sp.]